jgi:hypothetical protein
MAVTQRFPHHRKKAAAPAAEGSLWLNPYLLGAGFGALALVGVMVYHVFFAVPTLKDSPSSSSASGSSSGPKSSSLFGRSLFSQKPVLDLNSAEMDALGISKENRKMFDGVVPENFREKRRLQAMEKYEGHRRSGDERNKMLVDVAKRRSDPAALELREAFESLRDSETLGLMKLESFVTAESAKQQSGSTPNADALAYAYQTLTDMYIKKNMRGKAKEAYIQYLRVMKEKAPAEQGQSCDQAISEIERFQVPGQ